MATAGKKPLAELFSDFSLHVDLPNRIGEVWDILLIRLGLTSINIQHINHDHQRLRDKIKDGLFRWNTEKIQRPVSKRAADFLEALRAEGMVQLVEELEDEYAFDEPELVENTPGDMEDSSDKFADKRVIYTREASGDSIMNSLDPPTNDDLDLPKNGPDMNGDFPLRDYQIEIAQDGLKGENSIIWAGTGSGKTRVALYIMKNHLDNNQNGRIAFFNTTVALLNQQYDVIRKFLPKYKNKIMKFSGEDRTSDTPLPHIQDFRVCVLTPMTLEKYLHVADSASLNMFSMLVFDECHHTRKKEGYNQIMKYYRKLLRQGNTVKLPQIIGLTASVGTERACNVNDAEKSILELMARMNVHKIATPRINREEYTQFVPDPTKHSEIMKDRETDPIRDTIENAMNRLEEWLQNRLCELDKNVHKVLGEVPENKRVEQQYQSWLSRLLRTLLESEELTPENKRRAIVIWEHLTMYQSALSVNQTLCMKDVLEHLYRSSLKYKILEGEKQNAVVISNPSQNERDEGHTVEDNTGEDCPENDKTAVKESGKTEQTTVSLYKYVTMKLELLSKNEENENPNIVRLQKMVDKNFEVKGEDSTFIVFVEQRESAVAVSKYLREKSSFAKCCFLISAQSSADGDGKQSQAEQNRVVKKLRSKQINGLVATQVAEEGLDITACNFVIRYNKSSNEISTIQAAGRSRAKDGTIIDFADQQKHRKEKENVMKLALMNQALDAVLGRPADNIRLEVTKHIDSLIQIEAEEERSSEAGRKNKKEGNFTLRCWRCQEVAVSSHDIRRYKESNYIVVGEEFYKKAKRRLNKKVCCYENMTTKYKVDCKKCGSDWGVGNCMQNWFFAVLKIKQFIVKDDDTGKEYCRVPWSALPHTVQTITDFSSLPALDKLIEDSTDT